MSNPPTCGVVVEKEGENEKICGQPATQMVNMTDPDDKARIRAIVLLCDKHDADMEAGKMLIVLADDGEHLAIQSKQ